jgi:hypothetical protein
LRTEKMYDVVPSASQWESFSDMYLSVMKLTCQKCRLYVFTFCGHVAHSAIVTFTLTK